MIAARPFQHRLLRLASLVLVLPFVLLAGIAQGYMPVQGKDGGITMVICSAAGPVEMALDPQTGDLVPHDRAGDDGRCAWAQIAASALLPDMVPPLPPRRLVSAPVPVSPDDLWRPAHDPRGLWARGPPAFV